MRRRRPRRHWPKASTTERGYGADHRKVREQWKPRVDAGLESCRRCGRMIRPGEPWDLDHTDDRSGYLGPSHARCNRATAGRRKRKIEAAREAFRVSREW